MVCERFITENSFVHRTDPRLRLVAGLVAAFTVAFFRSPHASAAALMTGIFLVAVARLNSSAMVRRLITANIFFLLIALSFLFSETGAPAVRVAGLPIYTDGLDAAVLILLKGNAIILFLTVFLGTVELNRMGHAAQKLGAPSKLVQIFFFAVRYLDELHHELDRLMLAMRARGFRARPDAHTVRTYGYLTGTLLLHSLERADRILAAMKCRGFDGRFHSMETLAFTRRDAWIGAAVSVGLICLIFLEIR